VIIDRNPYVLALIVAGVCAMVPVLRPDDLTILGVGFLTFIFVTQAVSWNLVGGFAGQVSFGFAAFFGTGAYVTAILWSRYGWEPVLTLPVAGLAAMVVALLVGLPCFRLSGPYFSIATIGVGEAARVIAINLDNITRRRVRPCPPVHRAGEVVVLPRRPHPRDGHIPVRGVDPAASLRSRVVLAPHGPDGR